jgi:2,3-bisphosphoglycerate-dependent phosphoglycerate mutase
VARKTALMEALLVPPDGELILVRHGQQGDNGLNDPNRPYGGDVDLSDLGRRQAEVVAAALAAEPLDAVYASPLRRAAQTAHAVAAPHGLTPVVDERLVEIQGYRDLAPGETVASALGPEGLAAMRARMVVARRWDALERSEPRDEFEARVAAAVAAVLASHSGSYRVALVCHSGVINSIVARVLGMDTDFVSFVAHASISRVLTGDGRLAVRSVGDEGHLRAAGLLTY